MENLKKAMIIRNGNVVGAVGDKNFSTAPIGTVLAYAGNETPRGYLLADGASYPTADYPDLYAVIGNTYGGDAENFNVPDYRETVLVGVGENTTDTIASHDVYELGEFKDDQFQGHWHNLGSSDGTVTVSLGAGEKGSSTNSAASDSTMKRYVVSTALDAITDGTNGEPRKGTTTHGKQKGVTYIIKAFHTNEGTDTGVSDDVVEYVDNKIASEIEETIDFSNPILHYEGSINTTDTYTYTTTQKTMFVCHISGTDSASDTETDRIAYCRIVVRNFVHCSAVMQGDMISGLGNSCILPKGTQITMSIRSRRNQLAQIIAYAIE